MILNEKPRSLTCSKQTSKYIDSNKKISCFCWLKTLQELSLWPVTNFFLGGAMAEAGQWQLSSELLGLMEADITSYDEAGQDWMTGAPANQRWQ